MSVRKVKNYNYVQDRAAGVLYSYVSPPDITISGTTARVSGYEGATAHVTCFVVCNLCTGCQYTSASGITVVNGVPQFTIPANDTASAELTAPLSNPLAGPSGLVCNVYRASSVTSFGTFGKNTCTGEALIPQLNPIGQNIYCSPGAYTWIAPAGITKVSAVAIGAGGSGSGDHPGHPQEGASGGGALAYMNNIDVTPGTCYCVCVGGPVPGDRGRASFFISKDVLCAGGGRYAMSSGWWLNASTNYDLVASCNYPECMGCYYVNPCCGSSRGGGNGGPSGMMRFTRGFRGGGGGAGGYGGTTGGGAWGGCGGGAAATCRVAACAAGGATGYSTGDDTCYCVGVVCTLPTAGRCGGGGGGATGGYYEGYTGAGGGTGIWGLPWNGCEVSGCGATGYAAACMGFGGAPCSGICFAGGCPGEFDGVRPHGGSYGGGSGWRPSESFGNAPSSARGARGAVRIIWGCGASFPYRASGGIWNCNTCGY